MSKSSSSADQPTRRRSGTRRTLSALAHLPLVLLGLLWPAQSSAQFTQYVAPGSLGEAPQGLKERLEEGSANARWKLGKLRVDPQLFVRDLGYQSNVFGATDREEEVSDYRLLVAAGLDTYLPLGSKAMFAAFVTPEYSWWAEREELRQLNLSFGAGLFGFFNRMTISTDGRRLEQESVLNAELSAPFRIREDRLSVAVDVEVRRSLFAFVALRSSEYRHSGAAESQVEGLDLRALDRDFDSSRAGVRADLGPAWSVALGLEETQNDFLFDPDQRSNRGTSPFTEVRFEGNRIAAQLSLVDTELDFAEGSPLTSFGSRTGTARLRLDSPLRLQTTLYAGRNIVFSARESDSLFVEERFGLSIGSQQWSGMRWLVFLESGEITFSAPGADGRIDDLTAFGVNLGRELGRRVSIVLVLEQTAYESTRPEFDRSSSRFGLRLAFRDNLFPF